MFLHPIVDEGTTLINDCLSVPPCWNVGDVLVAVVNRKKCTFNR